MDEPSSPPIPTFFFDLVDPLSFLLERELRALEADLGIRVQRVGVEVRPPPLPLTDPSDPWWADRWKRARELARELGVGLSTPSLVPWSRKAHELLRHAEEKDREEPARLALFDAFFLEGRDIGRVDVLVDVARALGLDPTEAKAVLDVDRHEADVQATRDEAIGTGVRSVPLLRQGTRALEGFHNRARLGTFLVGSD